jgi:hypothetical protein
MPGSEIGYAFMDERDVRITPTCFLPCHEIHSGVEMFASILTARLGGFECSN